MKGNLHGVEQVVAGAAVVRKEEVGQVVVLQSPQFPFMWLPYRSVRVEHQGAEKPPAVVQLV